MCRILKMSVAGMTMPWLTRLPPAVAYQQTRGIHPMLFPCWASVEAGEPTLKQHQVNYPPIICRSLPAAYTYESTVVA